MKRVYLPMMMLAMIVAALGVTACGGDDEEVNNISIVGVWETVSVDIDSQDGVKVTSDLQAGDKFYVYADGTYKLINHEGKWILEGNSLTIIENIEYVEFEVVKLTSKELIIKIDLNPLASHTTSTLKFKRIS